MLATRTRRTQPFSVHMSAAEVNELLEEFADAVPFDPDELPRLAAVRSKLIALCSDPRRTRA